MSTIGRRPALGLSGGEGHGMRSRRCPCRKTVRGNVLDGSFRACCPGTWRPSSRSPGGRRGPWRFDRFAGDVGEGRAIDLVLNETTPSRTDRTVRARGKTTGSSVAGLKPWPFSVTTCSSTGPSTSLTRLQVFAQLAEVVAIDRSDVAGTESLEQHAATQPRFERVLHLGQEPFQRDPPSSGTCSNTRATSPLSST